MTVDANGTLTQLGSLGGEPSKAKLTTFGATIAVGTSSAPGTPVRLPVKRRASASWKRLILPSEVESPYVEFDSTGSLWVADKQSNTHCSMYQLK